jgi:hypothetical protein
MPPSLANRLFLAVSCLAYSSALKMKAVHYSETFMDLHETTRRYISENFSS